jgi:CDP-2,3-bis-(O-geranylgeranyl)-sn-glycerol synthase
VSGLLVFVPVVGAALAHAPVLTWDLLRPLKRPLDGGATVRGRRLFGDNKTWRGALAMSTGVLAATLLLSLWDGYWDELPAALRSHGALALGALIAAATVLGELPNSFLKRQLGIEPGARRRSPLGVALAVFDQADFVPFIALFLLPLWTMPLTTVVVGFAAVTAVHLVINVLGYAIGARSAPI